MDKRERERQKKREREKEIDKKMVRDYPTGTIIYSPLGKFRFPTRIISTIK